tara:strand:- start:58 stop:531 length:474 start_codon:yes stop_codon:yes gene_type:complete
MNIIKEKVIKILSIKEVVEEKLFGIYLLEKLKYLIINEIKTIDNNILENILKEYDGLGKNCSDILLENDLLISNINFYKDSVSNIKTPIEHDTLFLVISGFKNINIYNSKNKKTLSLSILKNTGIVLSNNSISSEKIGPRSIIIDIVSKKDSLNIEN